MPLLAVAATTMDTTDRMVLQDGSPGSGSGQSQVRSDRERERESEVIILPTYNLVFEILL